jgi:hypothetical protein
MKLSKSIKKLLKFAAEKYQQHRRLPTVDEKPSAGNAGKAFDETKAIAALGK